MSSRVFVIFLALLGVASAFFLVYKITKTQTKVAPLVEPAKNPYSYAISATGIVEAIDDNTEIGAPKDGLVDKIYVKVWQEVNKGDPLFKLDTRDLEAELKLNQTKSEVAKAKKERLLDQLQRLQAIEDLRAVSTDQIRTKENDVLVAEQEYKQAQAEVELTQALIDRMTVRSPRKGVVIQKNILEGEYLPLIPKVPALLLGELDKLQIRADIDEQNASSITKGAKATAYPKNNPNQPIPLRFIEIEPYVLPKKSLTGLGDERVDTRVLQVIYAFDPPKNFKIYVGQQVDVFIQVEE